MFEYQTAISELTGLPVSNASVYEGPSAVAAAGYLAKLETRRTKLVASRGLHPLARRARTHAAGYGMEVVEVPLDGAGATDGEALAAAVDDDTAAVFVQQPNFLGTVEELASWPRRASRPARCSSVPPTAPARGPQAARRQGVDVCVGEGQSLGNRLDFGGPSFGFFAAAERFIRKMPGRIAGETLDAEGRRGFVLTLQTREQHIRREKATHNICTAQALNALAGVVYLSWLGKRGLVELGELMLRRTHYAREALGLERSTRGRSCASSPCACRTSTGSSSARGPRASTRLPARPRLPRVRGRPAGRDHRAPHEGADRPARARRRRRAGVAA